jgi:preprotein translocase subunit SecA
MNLINNILGKLLGNKNEKTLKLYQKNVGVALSVEKEYQAYTLDELREKTILFKNQLVEVIASQKNEIDQLKSQAESSEDPDQKEKLYQEIDKINKEAYQIQEKKLNEIEPYTFALLKETARRFVQNQELVVKATPFDRELSSTKEYVTIQQENAIWKNEWNAAGKPVKWDMLHYEVQLLGGGVLHSGKIAEMSTGEGKTLVATLPIFLNALTGRGVHVVTVNDYLAKRDSAWMAPLFEFHGLKIDCIDLHQPSSEQRRNAYLADITYGTNNEFGFDYLRDNMATEPESLVQRELNFAIIDEVDSVLIDDARTPLIISGPVAQADRHEFDVLKPVVESIVKVQREELNKTFIEAKKLLEEGQDKEGGNKLFQVYRGLPKLKPLIKYLSQDGIKAKLQKTENYFMQDNNREMPKIDKYLYFVIDEKHNQVELTDKGIEFLSRGMEDKEFFVLQDVGSELAEIEKLNISEKEKAEKKEDFFRDFSIKSERIHTLNQLLKAYTLFEKDVEYVVIDREVKIVDEQTGRIMEGRRYSDGLHQALEAKEEVKIEAATQTFATVTLQNFFRMYNKLAGMTGTAETEAGEFFQIYKLEVVVIPTNKPIQRKDEQDKVYKTTKEKFNAVIEEIERLSNIEKRPVLVGTTSVEISEFLSKTLKLRKIPHNVLNAKLHKKEADIVAEAGRPGVVTIATNMAGRGTDIKLAEGVAQAGGLAIIGTERHDSRRVDRQLRGRAGRQGDPGSSQFFVSLEDNLMRLFGSDRIARIMDRMGHEEGDVIQHSIITKSIERAQKKVEENNFGTRKHLLDYDDVMNRQREVIYRRRKNALFGDRLNLDILNMIYDTCDSLIKEHKALNDYEMFNLGVITNFAMQSPISKEDFSSKKEAELVDVLFQSAEAAYKIKMEHLEENVFPVIKNVFESNSGFDKIRVPFTDGTKALPIISDLKHAFHSGGKSIIKDFERGVTLSLIDEHWKEHLRDMDELRKSVRNATYEQKDPLVIYKQESFYIFKQMIERLSKEVISFLFRGELPDQNANQIQQARKIKPQPNIKITRGEEQDQPQYNTNGENTPNVIEPRKVIKMGRNDKVVLMHTKSGEQREMKFKQAIAFIEGGDWVLMREEE